MTDAPRPNEVFEIEPRETGGLFVRMPWWLLATIAFLVAELTAHPAIGIVVLCLKFGWDDFLTARWLKRRDPEPARGESCWWFYLASGLWRVCIWSFGLLFTTLVVLILTEIKPGQRAPARVGSVEALTCLVVWLSSSAVATILTIIAVIVAWRRGWKVWLTGSLAVSRRRDHWPPRPRIPGRNLLRWWLVAAGVVVLFALCFVAFVLAESLGGFGRAVNGPLPAFVRFVIAVVTLIVPTVAAFSILSAGSFVFSRIGALTPTECWPDLSEHGYPTVAEWRQQLVQQDLQRIRV